eukprot:6071151-Pyramimonas_sp.AAC.1
MGAPPRPLQHGRDQDGPAGREASEPSQADAPQTCSRRGSNHGGRSMVVVFGLLEPSLGLWAVQDERGMANGLQEKGRGFWGPPCRRSDVHFP